MADATHTWQNALKAVAAETRFPKGTAIHFQGERPTSIGWVAEGEAEAVYFSENGDEIWIGCYVEGDFVGHLALLNDTPNQYELIAKSELTLWVITPEALTRLLSQNADLRTALTEDFAKRLSSMSHSLIDAYALSAKGRICSELIRLSHEIGIDPGKFIIRPNPVCVELARRVNSTRETVSRTISELQKRGILTRQPGALIVENQDKLRRAFQ